MAINHLCLIILRDLASGRYGFWTRLWCGRCCLQRNPPIRITGAITEFEMALLQELLMALRANDADGYKAWLALGIQELGGM